LRAVSGSGSGSDSDLRVGCAEWVPDAVKPGIHCVGTRWIRGFMALHRERARARRARAGSSRRGRAGGGAYGMMWKKGGVWGLGVI
jgi:hypothetical protein